MKVRYKFKISVDTDKPSGLEPDADALGEALSAKIKEVVIDGKVIELSNIQVEHIPPVGIMNFLKG